MEKLKIYLLKNWKTTVAGAAMGFVAILVSAGTITPDQAHIIALVLAGAGFAVSQDANNTPTTPAIK